MTLHQLPTILQALRLAPPGQTPSLVQLVGSGLAALGGGPAEAAVADCGHSAIKSLCLSLLTDIPVCPSSARQLKHSHYRDVPDGMPRLHIYG